MTSDADSVGGYFRGLITKNNAIKSISGNLRGLLFDTNVSNLLLFVTIVLLLVWWLRRRSKTPENQNIPPGSYGFPVLGETIQFLADGPSFFQTRLDKYGPIYRTHLLGRPFVCVSGAQHVNAILSCDDIIQCSPDSLKKLFGRNGFYGLNREQHLRLNKNTRSVLNSKTMASFTQPMQHIVRQQMETWLDRGLIQGVDASKDISFAVANELILGFDFKGEELDKLKCYFADYNDAFLSFPVDFPGFVFHRGMKARAAVLKMIENVVISPSPNGISLLHKLVKQNGNMDEADEPLTSNEMQDIALTMVYGSQETVSSALSIVLMQLAEHPHVLDDLRAELVANDIGVNDYINYETMRSLRFLNDVTREVLRHTPPIAGVFRKAIKDIEIGGYVIPKDYNILFVIKSTHTQCKGIGDVNTFDPYRWEKTKEKLSSRDYIPFGYGTRTCVGKDVAIDIIKVFIMELSRCVQWKMINGMPELRSAPVPTAKDGLPLAITAFDFAKYKSRYEGIPNEE